MDRVLGRGGRGSSCVLAAVVEEEGPFNWLREVVIARFAEADQSWEDRLPEAVTSSGGELIYDDFIEHPMRHPSAVDAWNALADSGPVRCLLDQQNEKTATELRQAFLARSPQGPVIHRPRARRIVARKKLN